MLAPIVLFVYNRPEHTKITVDSLKENYLANDSILYIFSDAPKNDNAISKVKEVRKLLHTIKGFKKIEIIEHTQNKGIESSEIEGITSILDIHERIIVLEDDLYTSRGFLKFINDGLEIYKNTNVFSINGFMFPIEKTVSGSFLCPLGTTSWGWGTWKDKWNLLEQDFNYKNFIELNPIIKERFNFGGYDYLSLVNLETWDIRWYYTTFIRNGLGLYPTKSLVKNIGFDGSGVHYTSTVEINQDLYDCIIEIDKTDKINFIYYDKLLRYYKDQFGNKKNSTDILHRIISKIKFFL